MRENLGYFKLTSRQCSQHLRICHLMEQGGKPLQVVLHVFLDALYVYKEITQYMGNTIYS